MNRGRKQAKAKAFVAYYRVSTERQGKSGLGLEGQRKAVLDFINGGRVNLIAEFTEVETGKRNDRPELDKAIKLCRKERATLAIAKLDRLARNVAFIANLMDAGVDFIAVDMPYANPLTVHILAAVAQHERGMISERTKAALQAAKARGVKLGSPDPGKGSRAGVTAHKAKADRFAANVAPVIGEIEGSGVRTLAGIAKALNARGIATARGGDWYPATVRNVVLRTAQRAERS